MRFSRRHRRASLTPASGGLLLLRAAFLALAASAAVAVAAGSAQAVGSDDYPAKLKSASQDSLVDPWFFYNRECTSFVAWRLNHDSGIPFTNKYLGHHWGDARIWKQAALDSGVTVDDAPVVGAVAWWAAGSVGSSHGHVAYVDKVTPYSIVIEEYNYLRRGYYDTRTLPVTSGSWPSGFIHVGDTALSNIAPPSVTGTARVGAQLTAAKGRWTPSGASFRYQWLAGGRPVAGATGRRFVPTAAQLKRTVQVSVTATKAGVSPATALSATTPKVAPGIFTTTAAPSVMGTPQVGVPLLASSGSWSPEGSYTYQWSVDGTAVAGATGMSYTPAPADVGKPVTVTVTATLPGYTTARSTSAATADVIPGVFDNTAPPVVIGTPQVDHKLSALRGSWTPVGHYAYQWLANGVPIRGATHSTYIPTAATVDQALTFVVTATAPGYDIGTASSAATAPVMPGTFAQVTTPAVQGAPRVGVPLTAAAGSWTPKPAAVEYQWLADGVAIPGATGTGFTPTPDQFGKELTFQVTATRPGYTDSVDTTAATVPVAPGHVSNTAAPSISGTAWLGRTLQATAGRWSQPSDTVRYQWLRDGAPIPGATESAYTLVDDDVAHRLSVRVTSSTYGYDDAVATSGRTARVLRGAATPGRALTISGNPVLGRTVWVPRLHATPSDATVRYQWYRGSRRIAGATGQRYVVQPADVGHRLRAVVRLSAADWRAYSAHSTWTTKAVERPRFHAGAHRAGRSVTVDLAVLTTLSPHVRGTVTVSDARRTLGTMPVVRAAGHVVVDVPRRFHTLTLAWSGSGRVAARTIVVRIR